MLVTDHKPLTTILGHKGGIPSSAAARLQQWALILSAYVTRHGKIGLMCTQNLTTFLNFPNLPTIYEEFHEESIAIYRTSISLVVKEICTIIRIGIFCVHKPGFLMLGHIYIYY